MEDKIVLIGGKSWSIPPLLWKQTKKIVPLLQRLSKNDAIFTTEGLDDLTELIFIGIQAGMPGFKKDELEALPINPFELLRDVVPVIARQALLKSGEVPAPGEAMAENSTSTN